MESPRIPTRQVSPHKLSGAHGKMLCLQGSGTSLLQPMQKTQLSSPTPSLLPPLLPACTPLPLPCRVWQRGESPPRMDLSPLEPPASCACPAPECGASLCCCTIFQKETEKGELTLEALFLLQAQTGAFNTRAQVQQQSNAEIHSMVTVPKSVLSSMCCAPEQ